jgi:hypothetical protein
VEKELNTKEALAYLAERGRQITLQRMRQIYSLVGTPKEIIYARHTDPANPRRGQWLVTPSELDKLLARGNRPGNPSGFNEAARKARWQKDTA